MLNDDSIKDTAQLWEGFVRPCNQTYSFGNVGEACRGLLLNTKFRLPKSILNNQNILNYDKVILVIADGLGWELFHRASQDSLNTIDSIKDSKLSRLTSIFPSSTTPSLIKLHSNRGVLETGIIDWTYYEHSIGQVICPILNSSAKHAFGSGRQLNTLKELNIEISEILKPHNYYLDLVKKNIQVKHYLPDKIYSSTFSKWSSNNLAFGYQSLEDVFNDVIQFESNSDKKSLTTIYMSQIDSLSHSSGPFAEKTIACVNDFIKNFITFINKAKKSLSNTLILLTADHGQMPIKETIFLDELIPNLVNFIEKDADDLPILPCGSSRSLFLNVVSDKIAQVTELLNNAAKDKAKIFPLELLLEEKIFGNSEQSNAFASNTGKICILPNDYYGFFWNFDGLYNENLKGAHGGLSKEEIYIPLLTIQV